MKKIKLIALDLDGTLFNNRGEVTPACRKAIREAIESGVAVVISTGRPLSGIPLAQLSGTGIRYAITTNGSGIYEIDTETDHSSTEAVGGSTETAPGKTDRLPHCISENAMEPELIVPILEFLETKDIHMDAFIHGHAFTAAERRGIAEKLDVPPSLKKYIINTRVRVFHLTEYIQRNALNVQKMTLNFYALEDGTRKDRDCVKDFLLSRPGIQCVSGGYNNLEFTKAGVTKGTGLMELADYLHIPIDRTLAVGDTENDISILEAAGTAVAMANATEDVKAVASYITASNEEDGVAQAIRDLVLT